MEGSFVGEYIFKPALEAKESGQEVFKTIGNPNTRFQTVHTDDFADLFVRVGERVNQAGSSKS